VALSITDGWGEVFICTSEYIKSRKSLESFLGIGSYHYRVKEGKNNGHSYPFLCLESSSVPAIMIVTHSFSVRYHVSQCVSLVVFLHQRWRRKKQKQFSLVESKIF
jgi:hypothetical protein